MGLAQQRRPEGVSVHDWQHQLIHERYTAWQQYPRRTGVDRVQRREHLKRAWWTMVGHLRAHHGIRFPRHSVNVDWAAAHTLHVVAHDRKER